MNGILALGGSQGGGMSLILVYGIVMIAIMFFLSNRSQKKEQKRIDEMFSNMHVGDSVLTTGGFYGVVIDIGADTVIVEFGSNKNCRIPMQKSAIARVEKADI